jgi:hypothetical protein
MHKMIPILSIKTIVTNYLSMYIQSVNIKTENVLILSNMSVCEEIRGQHVVILASK